MDHESLKTHVHTHTHAHTHSFTGFMRKINENINVDGVPGSLSEKGFSFIQHYSHQSNSYTVSE